MMMTSFSLTELAHALSASVQQGASNTQAQRINTDTRTLTQGDVFLALRGDNFDGHDYFCLLYTSPSPRDS